MERWKHWKDQDGGLNFLDEVMLQKTIPERCLSNRRYSTIFDNHYSYLFSRSAALMLIPYLELMELMIPVVGEYELGQLISLRNDDSLN